MHGTYLIFEISTFSWISLAIFCCLLKTSFSTWIFKIFQISDKNQQFQHARCTCLLWENTKYVESFVFTFTNNRAWHLCTKIMRDWKSKIEKFVKEFFFHLVLYWNSRGFESERKSRLWKDKNNKKLSLPMLEWQHAYCTFPHLEQIESVCRKYHCYSMIFWLKSRKSYRISRETLILHSFCFPQGVQHLDEQSLVPLLISLPSKICHAKSRSWWNFIFTIFYFYFYLRCCLFHTRPRSSTTKT